MIIPNFFKEFPHDKKKKSKWEIKIIRLHFHKDEVIVKKTIKCSLRKAYLLARLLALYEDIRTKDHYFGVAWNITDLNDKTEYGYRMLNKTD